MKRLTSVLLLCALVLSAFLCGCAKPEPKSTGLTSAMIAEANTLEKYLARYESVFAENTDINGTVRASYADRSGSGFIELGSETFFVKDGSVLLYSQGEYCGVIDEGKYNVLDDYISIAPEFTALETVVSEEEKDGTLFVTTVTTGDSVDTLLADVGITEKSEEGDKIVLNYELEPGTLMMKSCESKYLSVKAGEKVLYKVRVVYDRPQPVKMAEFEKTYDEGEKRTVTVIRDPGKPEETAFTCTLPKGLQVMLAADNDVYEIYTDPEGKEILSAPTPRDVDVTVYLIRK
ncbi:MAG: hypothetical protein IJS65_06350 [Clostridia bacterium]|nr:hypothetical protein [Clostridia bacterium]